MFDKLCGTFSALSSSPTRAESEARLQLSVYSAEMRWDCRMCVSLSRLKSLLPQWGWCAPGLPPPPHSCLSPTTLPGIVLPYVGPVLLFLHRFYQRYTFTQEDGFTEKLFRLNVKEDVCRMWFTDEGRRLKKVLIDNKRQTQIHQRVFYNNTWQILALQIYEILVKIL